MAKASTPLDLMTEKELSANIVQVAAAFGWLSYHTYRSMNSPAGFPDWVFVRPPRLLFVELKSAKGKMRPLQQLWIDRVGKVPNVEAYVIRPAESRWFMEEVLR
jgi:hypothetical protein